MSKTKIVSSFFALEMKLEWFNTLSKEGEEGHFLPTASESRSIDVEYEVLCNKKGDLKVGFVLVRGKDGKPSFDLTRLQKSRLRIALSLLLSIVRK